MIPTLACDAPAPSLYVSQNGGLSMRKKLSAIGNSLGIVIEKPILELLDIDRETELDMRTDGERLIIEPVRGAKRTKVKAAVQRAMAAHDATSRKLAK
jgi:antitoxin MazE